MPSAKTPEPTEQPALRADALQLPNVPLRREDFAAMATKYAPLFPPGAKLHVRNQGEYAFVTADPNDTLLFPKGHPKEGQDRYAWSPHPTEPGVSVGVRVPE